MNDMLEMDQKKIEADPYASQRQAKSINSHQSKKIWADIQG